MPLGQSAFEYCLLMDWSDLPVKLLAAVEAGEFDALTTINSVIYSMTRTQRMDFKSWLCHFH